MKLRFDPHLAHQRVAIDAVVDAFAGQPLMDATQRLSAGRSHGVVANHFTLDAAALATNLAAVQTRAGLPVTAPPTDPWSTTPPQLSVEMETGTGKTYVYLRTALELAERYGLRKYVVVVPSVAIREGVIATLRATAEHFLALYPGTSVRSFAYDGGRLGRVRSFARSCAVELMVVTLDAFNKARNRIRQPHDGFGGLSPLSLLQACRPVVIVDEPQRMESARSRAALDDLCPLFVLRYGATHRDARTLVHRLSPRQAYERALVKRIEVDPVASAVDDREARMTAQIQATVQHHVARQARLRARGIKVLSLLFVERVADWVEPDGIVRRELARCLAQLPASSPLGGATIDTACAAYFAEQRRRGTVRAIDSRTGRSMADERAYTLIMRDKARLLSFEESVCFVVSHSALREGWDNPNVFQICTLAHSKSKVRKRQEIGRGVRLCVDQQGRRVRDPEVDVLTVIVNDSYEDYVAALQAEDATEFEPDRRAPPPARAPRSRSTVSPERARADAVAWVGVDSPRLRRDAIDWLVTRGTGDRGDAAEPAAVMRALLRRRPPCLVSHATITALLFDDAAQGRSVAELCTAIEHALAAQSGHSNDAGGSAEQGVEGQQQQHQDQ